MSSTTWTPRAVASEAGRRSLQLWRAVEAQHIASTTRLVDSLDEQDLLEQILDQTKPALPLEAAGLHYLLATPFRYPPHAGGSRFRGANDPGVFYGADETRTACAELGFWRWRFVSDSDGLQELGPVSHTVFRVNIETIAIDLREKSFARHKTWWTAADNYGATQQLGRAARDAGVGMIRYQSVRDPQKGGCAALLTPAGFSAPRRPVAEQTWFLTVNRSSSAWQRDGDRFEFVWR